LLINIVIECMSSTKLCYSGPMLELVECLLTPLTVLTVSINSYLHSNIHFSNILFRFRTSCYFSTSLICMSNKCFVVSILSWWWWWHLCNKMVSSYTGDSTATGRLRTLCLGVKDDHCIPGCVTSCSLVKIYQLQKTLLACACRVEAHCNFLECDAT